MDVAMDSLRDGIALLSTQLTELVDASGNYLYNKN